METQHSHSAKLGLLKRVCAVRIFRSTISKARFCGNGRFMNFLLLLHLLSMSCGTRNLLIMQMMYLLLLLFLCGSSRTCSFSNRCCLFLVSLTGASISAQLLLSLSTRRRFLKSTNLCRSDCMQSIGLCRCLVHYREVCMQCRQNITESDSSRSCRVRM